MQDFDPKDLVELETLASFPWKNSFQAQEDKGYWRKDTIEQIKTQEKSSKCGDYIDDLLDRVLNH